MSKPKTIIHYDPFGIGDIEDASTVVIQSTFEYPKVYKSSEIPQVQKRLKNHC